MVKVFNWIYQIIYNVQYTIEKVLDFIVETAITPLFLLTKTIEEIIEQWMLKPNDEDEDKKNNNHIGFNFKSQ